MSSSSPPSSSSTVHRERRHPHHYHSSAARYKIYAIAINILLIVFSLVLLFLLYLCSTYQQTPNQVGEGVSREIVSDPVRDLNSTKVSTENIVESEDTLPYSLQVLVDWLAKSTLVQTSNNSHPQEFSSLSFLTTTSRPLIATAFLAYLLGIAGCIAIGLDHITLLTLLIVLYGVFFASSLTILVFSFLGSMFFENSFVLFDFWNSYFVLIAGVSSVQVCFVSDFMIF